MNENGTRQSVFLALVESDDTRTPSEIGEEIDETRQAVQYHLDQLVTSGLVVHSDAGYQCQPVFTDPEFQSLFIEWIGTLAADVNDRITVESEVAGVDRTQVVFNCIRMFVAIEMLGPADEATDNPE